MAAAVDRRALEERGREPQRNQVQRRRAAVLHRGHRFAALASALRRHGDPRQGRVRAPSALGAGGAWVTRASGGSKRRVRAIVLAAGKGTRMKSATPKVLHEICGRPMLWYVLRALRSAGIGEIVTVVNDELQERMDEFGVRGILQAEQLGTGHAVQTALAQMPAADDGCIVVAYGDMPLVNDELFRGIVGSLGANGSAASLAMVTVRMPLPSNFGRVIRRGHEVERVVEVRDATRSEE